MNTTHEKTSALIRLSDYRVPAWHVETVELDFDLDIDATEVSSRLLLRRDPGQSLPLRLDGENLQLLSIVLDGTPLPDTAYRYMDSVLEVDGARDGSVLETRVRLKPAANTTMEGLFFSGKRESGFLLTQCEAEGFRHITFFTDRPDVQSLYTVTLRADKARFPVLLAGGNADGFGELDDGRHWSRFIDPYRKPSYLFALVAGRLEKISRSYVTADKRAVTLNIWAESDAIGQCDYAMD
jgi:aminopeptidase N